MFFYVIENQGKKETKAEPNPNSNPTIACELLVPVLKYNIQGTTGCLFLRPT